MIRVGRGRFFYLWYAVWLVYLVEPLADVWRDGSPVARAFGVTIVALFAVVFLVFFTRLRRARIAGRTMPPAASWATVAAMAALTVAIIPVIGESALGMLSFVAITALFSLPQRPALALAGLMVLTPATVPHAVPGWVPRYDLSFSIFMACLIVWGVIQMLARNAELAAAREEIARLAVADERSRLARDLHDLLGHTLTVVTVKAELAGRLVRIAPDRAEAEVGDLERLARQALQDVRRAVAGYAEVTLAAEVAGARVALDAAGIEAEVDADVDAVPGKRRELFGWVVREGVTNVVRHSGATRCRIRVTASEVEIGDDGAGSLAPGGGRGLAGLRERVAAAGGALTVGRTDGFTLHVRVPA